MSGYRRFDAIIYVRPYTRCDNGVMAFAMIVTMTVVPVYLFNTINIFHRSTSHDVVSAIALLLIWVIGFLWDPIKKIPYIGKPLQWIGTISLIFVVTSFFAFIYWLIWRKIG